MLNLSNIPIFKCHASAAGTIMGAWRGGLTDKQQEEFNALDARYKGIGKPLTEKQSVTHAELLVKSKTPRTLPDTCTTYLKEWLIEQATGVRKEVETKQILKGRYVEDDAIAMLSEYYGWIGAKKNEVTFENEYFIGTPDIHLPALISDNKSPWDIFTFPWFYNECPEKDYPQQLQVYMDLTGVRKGQVDYTLMPTPEDVPQWWTSHLPPDLENWHISRRIKTYGSYDYDPEYIAALKQRVIDCREYISELLKTIEQ
jgi:hypothetical protein